MSYLKSNQIFVYPTATRTADGKYGRLTTEFNLTGNLVRLTDKKSFILNSATNIFDNETSTIYTFSDTHLNFVIGGYAVAVDESALKALRASNSELWAGITISNDDGSFPHLGSTDVDSSYEGVKFGTEGDMNGCTYKLKLLDTSGKIPREGYIRYTENSVYIDDGDLSSSSPS